MFDGRRSTGRCLLSASHSSTAAKDMQLAPNPSKLPGWHSFRLDGLVWLEGGTRGLGNRELGSLVEMGWGGWREEKKTGQDWTMLDRSPGTSHFGWENTI
jgi:hypothetical protein